MADCQETLNEMYAYLDAELASERATEIIGHLKVCTDCQSAEDQMLEMFTDDEVKNAIEELPETFRIPLLMSDLEGFSYKEIAEILEIPLGTVMSRLHRGRKAMQKMLYEYAKERGLINEALLSQGDDE